MSADDNFYRQYAQAQQQISHHDRVTVASAVAFTILLGYVAYYGSLLAGLPVRQLTASIDVKARRMLTHIGILPRTAVASRLRRISTGSQALDGALSGVLSPLKAATADRTLRTLGTLIGGDRSDRPPGMGNWDNSCYQNSVIQGLSALRPMEAFLNNTAPRFGPSLEDSTNSSLADTIRQLNDPGNNGKVLWMPKKLKSMSSWQQQDAQEYFSKILDEVDKELSRTARKGSTTAGLAEEPKAADATLFPPSQYNTRNPLEGFLAQRVACMQCGYSEGLSMIPFNCLTVPLGNEQAYDIRDCLDEYTNLEAIEGVECAKCTLLRAKTQLEQLAHTSSSNAGLQSSVQARLKAVQEVLSSEEFSDKALATTCQISKKNWATTTKSRQAVIARAPKCLVVHVNRSVFNELTGAQTKNYADVSFPMSLDLRPWCLGQDKAGREDWSMNPSQSMLPPPRLDSDLPPMLYSLRAAVTHYGRHENGHYVCYRKHPFITGEEQKKISEERWWRLSDEDVSMVSDEQLLQQGGVFMLFYERVEPSPPQPELLPTDVTITESAPLSSDEINHHKDDAVSLSEGSVTPEAGLEQRAKIAEMEASKSLLMAELRNALPQMKADDALIAVGQAEEDGDMYGSETPESPDDFRPPVPLPSASRVRLRTAGAVGRRRSGEAWDSPLRMASAF